MKSKDILKDLDAIESLPTLDTIAKEVNRVLQDHDTSIKKLSSIIEKDQAIVTRILRLVNSAFFGYRSKINNIPHAITLLGFNTVRNAVLSLSLIKAFSAKKALKGFNITGFWTHSIAVAITSRHLAEKTRLQHPDICFIGGLLHDIGKLILYQYFKDLFEQVWRSARQNNLSFYEAEKKEISVNHAQIGGHLAKRWQLPTDLVDTIRSHHAITKNVQDLNLLMIVHVADIIVNTYQDASRGRLAVSAIYPEARRIVEPQLDSSAHWFRELSPEIEEACQFFLREG